jgi:transposase
MGATEIVVRRRKWTPEEKAALLTEIEVEGGRVSVVARRHGMSDSLLYNWRSAWKVAASIRVPEPVEFVPIGVLGRGGDEGSAMMAAPEPPRPAVANRDDQGGMIEIDLSNGAKVRVDAFVNEKALSRVLRAMKGSV